MKKAHSYKGFDFYYTKTSKQKGGGGYFYKNLQLGDTLENAKWYIDWCLSNPTHENNLLK